MFKLTAGKIKVKVDLSDSKVQQTPFHSLRGPTTKCPNVYFNGRAFTPTQEAAEGTCQLRVKGRYDI